VGLETDEEHKVKVEDFHDLHRDLPPPPKATAKEAKSQK